LFALFSVSLSEHNMPINNGYEYHVIRAQSLDLEKRIWKSG